MRDNLFQGFLLASGGLLAISDTPWLTDASIQPLPPSSMVFPSLSLCLKFPRFIKTEFKDLFYYGAVPGHVPGTIDVSVKNGSVLLVVMEEAQRKNPVFK